MPAPICPASNATSSSARSTIQRPLDPLSQSPVPECRADARRAESQALRGKSRLHGRHEPGTRGRARSVAHAQMRAAPGRDPFRRSGPDNRFTRFAGRPDQAPARPQSQTCTRCQPPWMRALVQSAAGRHCVSLRIRVQGCSPASPLRLPRRLQPAEFGEDDPGHWAKFFSRQPPNRGGTRGN